MRKLAPVALAAVMGSVIASGCSVEAEAIAIDTKIQSLAIERTSRRLAGTVDQNGHIHVFMIKQDGSVWERFQTATGWAGWRQMADTNALSLDAALNSLGDIELLVVNGSHEVSGWTVHPDGGWGPSTTVDRGVKDVAVAQNLDGRMEAILVGDTGELRYARQSYPGGIYGAASSLATGVLTARAVRNADGRLEVVTISNDSNLWHQWQTSPGGAWSSAEQIDTWVKNLSVTRNADGRLEVLTVGGDNNLWTQWQTSPGAGWSNTEQIDTWVKDLSAVINADGRLEVLTVGGDNNLWTQWQTSPGSTWSRAERIDTWVKTLLALRNTDGRLEVFTIGGDEALWHQWQVSPGGIWSTTESFGVPGVSPPPPPPPPPPVCNNDGYCGSGENCANCPRDCGCSSGRACSWGACVVPDRFAGCVTVGYPCPGYWCGSSCTEITDIYDAQNRCNYPTPVACYCRCP